MAGLSSIKEIKFSSNSIVGQQVRDLSLLPSELGPAIGIAFSISPTKGLRLTKGLLETIATREQFETEAPELISWASQAGSNERRLIVKAMTPYKGGDMYLVHQIALMPRKKAKLFMPDYLAAGGDVKTVMEWLQIAGSVLRKHNVKASDTEGVIVDAAEDAAGWVADKAEDAVDTVAEAVETVVNAVGESAEALGGMIAKVADWAIDKISDVIQSLLAGIKTVGEIMEAALAQGIDVLKKFASALLNVVGKPVGQLLGWLINQAKDIASSVVDTLLKGLNPATLLDYAIKSASNITRMTVQAFLDLGKNIGQILNYVVTATVETFKAVYQAVLDAGQALGDIIKATINFGAIVFKQLVSTILNLGKSIAELLDEVATAVSDGLKNTVAALISLGKKVVDIVKWAVNKGVEIMKTIIQTLLEVGVLMLEFMSEVITGALSAVGAVLAALYHLGQSFAKVLRDLGKLSVDMLATVIQESLKLGKTLVSFMGHVISRTYAISKHFLEAALTAGIKVGELLGSIFTKTYWSVRKVVSGVLGKLGPIGEVLDWVLTQAEGVTDKLWHYAINAIRYANGKLNEALDWAVKQSLETVTAMVAAWEIAGEKLITLYKWASDKVTAGIWFVIGQVTTKLANSAGYAITYLEKDLIPGIRDFVKGMLKAGSQLATFVAEFAEHSLVAVTEIVAALLESGITIGALMTEAILHPKEALRNLLQAAKTLGKTTQDIVKSAHEAGDAVVKDVVATWKDLKVSAMEIINAALEVSLGAVGAVFSYLLMWFGVHRPLNEEERAAANAIFGKSIDLDRVLVSVLNLPVELIELCNKQRPFTTNFVLNFAAWKTAKIETVMHELTHVWQSITEGPFYMFEAIHAQMSDEKYNYGYTNSKDGEGAQAKLLDANGNFDQFNTEMQAKIIEHYYIRRFQENLPDISIDEKGKTQPSYQEWIPYAQLVRA